MTLQMQWAVVSEMKTRAQELDARFASVWCSALQCVAACCNLSQGVAGCCSVWQCAAACNDTTHAAMWIVHGNVWQCVAV